jgi:multidrug resistance efflux pump
LADVLHLPGLSRQRAHPVLFEIGRLVAHIVAIVRFDPVADARFVDVGELALVEIYFRAVDILPADVVEIDLAVYVVEAIVAVDIDIVAVPAAAPNTPIIPIHCRCPDCVQWERADQRREDLEKLGQRQATSQFNVQDALAQANALAAQLEAAKAREASARLAVSSEIDGENTAVAQLKAQLDNAEWELKQTKVSAPTDGYVTLSALAVGDRVAPLRGVMSFVVADGMAIVGVFQQNGLQSIRPGTPAKLVFSNQPGKVYDTKVLDIAYGVGQGQLAASGTLARVGSIGTTEYPVGLDIPQTIDRELVRPGMSGTATVLAPNAGVIGTIASILLWSLHIWPTYKSASVRLGLR